MLNEYYIFSPKEQEIERLKRLNEIYNPHTISYLDRIISTGMAVLEIGPGNGILATWICDRIGKNGEYVAIEQSSEAIDITRKSLDAHKNYTLINGLAEDIGEISEINNKKFDVIYCRWVMAYINPTHLEKTLTKFFNLLNPNGYLICEEGDVEKATCINISENSIDQQAFNQWFQLTFKIGKAFNYDFKLGSHIKSMIEKIAGYPPLISSFQPILETTYQKQIISFAMPAMSHFLIEHNLMNKEGIEKLTESLNTLAEDENLYIAFVDNTIASVQKRIT